MIHFSLEHGRKYSDNASSVYRKLNLNTGKALENIHGSLDIYGRANNFFLLTRFPT
jgi:hypothetical protein